MAGTNSGSPPASFPTTANMPPQQQDATLQEPLLPSVSSLEPHESTTTANVTSTIRTRTNHHRAHRNVTLTLWYTGLAFVGSSIWGNNVLATYVYLLRQENAAAVGCITGVMGSANLLCSIPAGVWADRHRRDAVLRWAAVLRAAAIAMAIYALTHTSYGYLLLALAIWGSSRGTANTALGAIFADSIPQGKRSYYFTQRTMLRTLGSTAGPIASCIMFVVLGDHWTLRDCSIVLMVGQVISVAAMVTLCFFNDDYIMEHPPQVEDDPDQEDRDDRESGINEEEEEALVPGRQDENVHDTTITVDDTDEVEQTTTTTTTPSWWYQRRVAILVATSDIITGLASGMSVRYFPIFFVTNLQLGPVMVQLLYVFGPLFQTALMRTSQWLSQTYGRCFISALFRWIGVTLMAAMILSYLAGLSTWWVCTFYVFRTAFVNGTKALTRSVLMDNVPKEERGRWSALESVNTLSWSGSAVIGGFLVGSIGILPLFVTTACLQICSTIPLVVLFRRNDQLETG